MHPSPLLVARLRRPASILLAAMLLALALPAGGAAAGGAIPLSSVTSMTTAKAAADRERLWADHCMGYERTTVPAHCTYGVKTSTTIVALVGDSHASQLFPAVEKLAKDHGWRLEVFVKVSCPFIDMRVRNLALGREYTECATWNLNVIRRIASLKPAMTLVAMSRFAIHPASAANNTLARKGAAIGREIARLSGKVTLIVDLPYAGRNEPVCLAAHRSDIRSCAIPKATGLSGSLGAIERIAVAATGDSLVDLTSAFCSTWPCPAVRNRAIVYRDTSHLTATFARTLAPALDAKLAPLVSLVP
jgi:hypothetical protein